MSFAAERVIRAMGLLRLLAGSRRALEGRGAREGRRGRVWLNGREVDPVPAYAHLGRSYE